MTKISKREAIKKIVGGALIIATSASIIGCTTRSNDPLSSDSVVVKDQDGQELKLTVKGDKVLVEKVSKGVIVENNPSGKFILQDGKSIVVEKGEITGGDSMVNGKFAAFALLRN